jgi:hypothetical protein
MACLIASNAYFASAYQGLPMERKEALEEAIIQIKGFINETIHMMNGMLKKCH